ncbi:MAG: serine/threonine-protein phosphatase [Bacteroidetes bacterium]|nr:MAG: serine/threonine-protein phosphatase [Bacteroidota bacterium]
MKNVYDTTDAKTLLQLKRLEADALLDVLRTINHSELKISQLCTIARNVLHSQLGVKKMAFYYRFEDEWVEGLRMNFDEVSPDARAELFSIRRLTEIRAEDFPALAALGVEYALPIINQNQPSAFFVIADFADSEVEAQNDLIFVETLGNILSVAIRNKQLFKEKMNRELLLRELEVAEAIQRQLLISDFSRFRELDVHGFNVAHHRIGGDFFDVIKQGKGTTFVCIADVSGKGIGAALLMSNLLANFRALCAQYSEVADIVRELNRILMNITVGEKFVTLFIAKIDTQQNKLTYINAGHNYPLFFHGGQMRYLDKGCLLLGIMPQLDIEQESLDFEAGDFLFMYTDGLAEQVDEYDEMFGTERIENFLTSNPLTSAREVNEQLYRELKAHGGQSEAVDDITMLSVKFL